MSDCEKCGDSGRVRCPHDIGGVKCTYAGDWLKRINWCGHPGADADCTVPCPECSDVPARDCGVHPCVHCGEHVDPEDDVGRIFFEHRSCTGKRIDCPSKSTGITPTGVPCGEAHIYDCPEGVRKDCTLPGPVSDGGGDDCDPSQRNIRETNRRIDRIADLETALAAEREKWGELRETMNRWAGEEEDEGRALLAVGVMFEMDRLEGNDGHER